MCAALATGGNMMVAQDTVPMLALNNGTQMPQLGIGTFLASPDDAYNACLTALKDGYRHINTAHAMVMKAV